jgi:phosphohistidine phosphatase SixA
MIILLVRHGRAGKRREWEGDDRARPLDKKGRRQAEGLVEMLRDYPVERVLSSPYIRCTQTVVPLASARRLEVEEAGELAEGTQREEVLGLLRTLDADSIVACTHGDVVAELVGEMLPKGSVQVLELDGGDVRRKEYLGRPGGASSR